MPRHLKISKLPPERQLIISEFLDGGGSYRNAALLAVAKWNGISPWAIWRWRKKREKPEVPEIANPTGPQIYNARENYLKWRERFGFDGAAYLKAMRRPSRRGKP